MEPVDERPRSTGKSYEQACRDLEVAKHYQYIHCCGTTFLYSFRVGLYLRVISRTGE
jgi:hypothetical protein